MSKRKVWTVGIILRLAAITAIAAAVAFAVVRSGPNLTVAMMETPAVKTDAPTTRYVRTIPISAQPLAASWPLPASAVTEAPAPAVETPAAPARAAKGPRQADDVCQRHGGHRENYQRGRWPAWRCVFPTKATKETRR